MAKVLDLLAKMGLVYATTTEPAADPGKRPPATASPVKPSGAAPRGGPSPAAPVPAVNLDTAAIQLEPPDDEYSLAQIYASAGIQDPPHGITVERLIEMLEAEEFRGMDGATRAKVVASVLRRLPAGAVEVDDIVRDAAQRDRALDAFETFLADRLVAQEREIGEKNRALQEEIDALTRKNTALMESNRAEAEKQRNRLERWRRRKQLEEERLYAAVAPFVENNPVTRGDPPKPPGKPAKG